MFEPTPRKVSPPKQEPTIRVGLVLTQDKLNSIHFESNQSSAVTINKENDSTIGDISTINHQNLALQSPTIKMEASQFQLSIKSDTRLSPNSGIKLSPIIAGRNFHWKKQIEATYPGKLEIYNQSGTLEVINEIPFEDYLACVVTSEMGSECPVEFMKAQIVAARSWAYVFLHDKHPGSRFDVCNDDDCQRYQGSTFLAGHALQASIETRGEFLVSIGLEAIPYVIPSYYFKTCGGYTEETNEILGFDELSLCSVSDSTTSKNIVNSISNSKIEIPNFFDLQQSEYNQFYCGQAEEKSLVKYLGKVDEGGSHFRWERIVNLSEMIQNLKDKCGIEDIKVINELNPVRRTRGGRITILDICYLTKSGNQQTIRLNTQYKIREALSPSFLPSSAFIYNREKNGAFHFYGAGWGHGVGLCQVGAVMMALAGKSYTEILQHYFPRSNLVKSYA